MGSSVALASLNLLHRYKFRVSHRQIKLRDPSRLYIAAYLVAAKAMSDHPYPMRTWASLAQNNYDTTELMDMEREFCMALHWDLRINDEVLDSFRIVVRAFWANPSGSPRTGKDSDNEHSDVPLPIPITPELDWDRHDEGSPRSGGLPPASTNASVSYKMAIEDDWVKVPVEESEQSRVNLVDLDGGMVGLENEYRCNHSSSAPCVGSTGKPSKRKRLSNLIQGKLGLSLLKSD